MIFQVQQKNKCNNYQMTEHTHIPRRPYLLAQFLSSTHSAGFIAAPLPGHRPGNKVAGEWRVSSGWDKLSVLVLVDTSDKRRP